MAVVLGFGLLLLLPALQMAHPFVAVRPVEENRVLAPPPKWRDVAHPFSFTLASQAWFEDHYGLRDLLIRLQAQIQYSVFGVSERLHIGRKGWLFYRSVIDQEEVQVESMSDAQLDGCVTNFARLRDWLRLRGVDLVVVTNQMKDRFYPEFLPRTAQRALGRHRFDDFRARLHKLPGITYIDTTPALLELRQQRPVFHKTDFHWNDPAAFVIAGQLVDTIAALDGRPTPYWHTALQIERRAFSGGQANFLPLFEPPHEQSLFVHPTWQNDYRSITDQQPFELVTEAPAGADRLPPVMVYGESFFEGVLRSGFANYFQTMAFGRRGPVPLKALLTAMPPGTRTVVVAFIELRLPAFLGLELP